MVCFRSVASATTVSGILAPEVSAVALRRASDACQVASAADSRRSTCWPSKRVAGKAANSARISGCFTMRPTEAATTTALLISVLARRISVCVRSRGDISSKASAAFEG
jgi:hypothetical protein